MKTLRDMHPHKFWRSPEVVGFVEKIAANPKDTLPLLVFADRLDEMPTNRHNRSLAFALRWAAERRRFPLVSPGGRVAKWLPEPPYRGRRHYGPYRPCVLPQLVFAYLIPRYPGQMEYKTNSVSGAFERLSMALWHIRDVIGWHI